MCLENNASVNHLVHYVFVHKAAFTQMRSSQMLKHIVCVCAHYCYRCVFAGEPSPPKLEGSLQSKGNALKVKWIKQDDGGSPITHYLIRYKAVSITGLKKEFQLNI